MHILYKSSVNIVVSEKFLTHCLRVPGMLPGDVVFVIQQREHDKFIRKGDDLLMSQKIKLVEALCGAHFSVKHLDDRVLVVKTQAGEIIRPGDVKTIDEEGMPMHKNPFVKVIPRALTFSSESCFAIVYGRKYDYHNCICALG